MNGNVELLNYIHQNSQMGQETLKHLIGIVEDESFKKNLQSQFEEYRKIFDESEVKLKEVNKQPKSINSFSKVSSSLMIDFQTLRDKTPTHISEMLIQGSTMGVIDITKKLNEYKDAEKDVVDLASKLLHFEQVNIDEMKKFLH